MEKVLECSSKGDKRFSAFFAWITVLGQNRSIEKHYQLAKRIGDFVPKDVMDVKGKQPTHLEIGGKTFGMEYLTPWYKLLWLLYLDKNPMLVTYASGFDRFNDIFRGKKSINCQADVVQQYVKQGRDSLVADCHELAQQLGIRL